jgi:hypothetical protein
LVEGKNGFGMAVVTHNQLLTLVVALNRI